jgi:hypothetical protein
MLTDERVVTFSQAAEHLPKINGKKIHVSAIWRWAREGVRGVRLEALLMGGRWLTSVQALERFGTAVAATGRDTGNPTPPRKRGRPSREKAIAAARADLARAGI